MCAICDCGAEDFWAQGVLDAGSIRRRQHWAQIAMGAVNIGRRDVGHKEHWMQEVFDAGIFGSREHLARGILGTESIGRRDLSTQEAIGVKSIERRQYWNQGF